MVGCGGQGRSERPNNGGLVGWRNSRGANNGGLKHTLNQFLTLHTPPFSLAPALSLSRIHSMLPLLAVLSLFLPAYTQHVVRLSKRHDLFWQEWRDTIIDASAIEIVKHASQLAAVSATTEDFTRMKFLWPTCSWVLPIKPSRHLWLCSLHRS